MSPELLLWVLVVYLGAAVGSFLNVVIYRVPRGDSVVSPRSRCPGCQQNISWYDNIPVLSWLFLLGKCRNCGQGISFRYPFVELITAMIAVVVFAQTGLDAAFFVQFAFACALVAVAYIDLDHQIIPDVISLPGIVLGLLVAAIGGWAQLLDAVVGVLVGGGILLTVAWVYEWMAGREGMGGGDVKLLAMIGAFLGWQGVLLTLLLGSLLGSAIGIVLMTSRGADRRLAIPFGPFLSLGALVALFWGPAIVRWYISYAGFSQI